MSIDINTVCDYVLYDGLDLFELFWDGVAFFVAVGALVDLQHDGDTVGGALPGENGIRDEAAGIGVIDLGGVAGAPESIFDDSPEFLGSIAFVCPDADVRGWRG